MCDKKYNKYLSSEYTISTKRFSLGTVLVNYTYTVDMNDDVN